MKESYSFRSRKSMFRRNRGNESYKKPKNFLSEAAETAAGKP